MTDTHLPVDRINAALRRIGRSLDDATEVTQKWQGDEYGLQVTWSDGFQTFVGLGPIASAVVEGWFNKQRH